MKRLAVLLPILVLMIAGCGSAQPQDEESAVDVVREFIDAVERGDAAAVTALYHPECPVYEVLISAPSEQLGWLRASDVVGWVPSVAAMVDLPDFQVDVQDVHVASESGRECTVSMTITYSATDPVAGPKSETATSDLHLVEYGGTWRLWDHE